jgi:hypothetical protein
MFVYQTLEWNVFINFSIVLVAGLFFVRDKWFKLNISSHGWQDNLFLANFWYIFSVGILNALRNQLMHKETSKLLYV